MHDVLLVLSALTKVVYGGKIQTRWYINRIDNAAVSIATCRVASILFHLPSNYLANKVKCKTTKYHNTSTGLWLQGPGCSVHPFVYLLTFLYDATTEASYPN
jgi:hypothetical protein